MGIRFPRTMFGVEIIYIREHVARRVVAIVPGGRSIWALLPDGRVGTSDMDVFRYSHAKGSRHELQVAEKLWRLGKLKKLAYQKLAKVYEQKQARSNKNRMAGELISYAKQLGLVLTKEQSAAIAKATGVTP